MLFRPTNEALNTKQNDVRGNKTEWLCTVPVRESLLSSSGISFVTALSSIKLFNNNNINRAKNTFHFLIT